MKEQICDYSCRSFEYFLMHGAACQSGGGIIHDEEIGKPCTLSEKLRLKYKLDENDLQDSLKLIQGMTDESLLQIQADLDDIFSDEKKRRKR